MAYLSKSWPILGQPVRNSWAIPRELRSPAKQHGNWPGIDRGDGEGSDGMRFMPSLPMQFQGNSAITRELPVSQGRMGGWACCIRSVSHLFPRSSWGTVGNSWTSKNFGGIALHRVMIFFVL